jgi:hypothetical protein
MLDNQYHLFASVLLVKNGPSRGWLSMRASFQWDSIGCRSGAQVASKISSCSRVLPRVYSW